MAEKIGIVQPGEKKALGRPCGGLSVLEGGLLAGPVGTGQAVVVLNRRRLNLDYVLKKRVFYNEDGKTLEQVAQNGHGCLIPGTFRFRLDRALSNLRYSRLL